MIKEFDFSVAFIISIFDGLLAGGIGGCLGGIVENVYAAIMIGMGFSIIMLLLDIKYVYSEV